jgi:hypothetical protein
VPRLTGDGSEALLLLAVVGEGAPEPSIAERSELVRAIFTEGYGLAADHPFTTASVASIAAVDE